MSAVQDFGDRWRANIAPRGMVVFLFIFGVVLTMAPDWWLGRTWWFYSWLPHGGTGLGITSLCLSATLGLAVHFELTKLASIILTIAGIVFWIAAILVASQGLSGHLSFIEALFMMYTGTDMLLQVQSDRSAARHTRD